MKHKLNGLRCKICGNDIIYVDNSGINGYHEIGCENLKCHNKGFFKTQESAFEYANILAGRPRRAKVQTI